MFYIQFTQNRISVLILTCYYVLPSTIKYLCFTFHVHI